MSKLNCCIPSNKAHKINKETIDSPSDNYITLSPENNLIYLDEFIKFDKNENLNHAPALTDNINPENIIVKSNQNVETREKINKSDNCIIHIGSYEPEQPIWDTNRLPVIEEEVINGKEVDHTSITIDESISKENMEELKTISQSLINITGQLATIINRLFR